MFKVDRFKKKKIKIKCTVMYSNGCDHFNLTAECYINTRQSKFQILYLEYYKSIEVLLDYSIIIQVLFKLKLWKL